MNKLTKLILKGNNIKFISNHFAKFSCTNNKYQEKFKDKTEVKEDFLPKTSIIF